MTYDIKHAWKPRSIVLFFNFLFDATQRFYVGLELESKANKMPVLACTRDADSFTPIVCFAD